MPPYDIQPSHDLPATPETMTPGEAHCCTREALLHDRALALSRANRELEQFAYTAAHDLQEPLRLMLSFTELFARRYGHLVDETGQQYLHFAVSGARQMKALVGDLIEYTRVASDTAPHRRVAMDDIARHVRTTLSGLVTDTEAVIELGPLPDVEGNPEHLELVLFHLVRNALRYRQPGVPPHIAVNARRVPSGWEFGVHDNGPGISPEYRERVFQVFQRLTRDRAQPGTGMGLALCQRIVELHAGRIRAESNAAGGTSVFFTLPASTDDEQPSQLET